MEMHCHLTMLCRVINLEREMQERELVWDDVEVGKGER